MPKLSISVVLAREIQKWALKLFATQTLKTICNPDTQGRNVVQKISFVHFDCGPASEQNANNAKPFFDNKIFYRLS